MKYQRTRVARHFAFGVNAIAERRCTFQKLGLARHGDRMLRFQRVMGNDEKRVIGKAHQHAAMQKVTAIEMALFADKSR